MTKETILLHDSLHKDLQQCLGNPAIHKYWVIIMDKELKRCQNASGIINTVCSDPCDKELAGKGIIGVDPVSQEKNEVVNVEVRVL